MFSVLDSGAEGPGFKSQPRRCRVGPNSPKQTVHTHCASVHQAAKLVAALLRVAGVTAGPPGGKYWQPTAWFMTEVTCRLPRTGISSGTLRSVIEYWLPFPGRLRAQQKHQQLVSRCLYSICSLEHRCLSWRRKALVNCSSS